MKNIQYYILQAFEALVSEEDNVLVEMPAYPGALAAVSITLKAPK